MGEGPQIWDGCGGEPKIEEGVGEDPKNGEDDPKNGGTQNWGVGGGKIPKLGDTENGEGTPKLGKKNPKKGGRDPKNAGGRGNFKIGEGDPKFPSAAILSRRALMTSRVGSVTCCMTTPHAAELSVTALATPTPLEAMGRRCCHSMRWPRPLH